MIGYAFWPAASIHIRQFEPVGDVFSGKLIHALGRDSIPRQLANGGAHATQRTPRQRTDRPLPHQANQTIDVKHPLVKLVAAIGWPGLETHFGAGQTAFFTGDSCSSTGDMLRAAVVARTPVGVKAKDFMARRELVPDDVVIAAVADRISQPDVQNGFILDGFPRTVAQAEALQQLLRDRGLQLDAVIELKVPDSFLLDRIRNRVTQSGGDVRADDTAEALERRLKVYHAQTAPLVAFYHDQGLLGTVDGTAPVEAVADQIDAILRRSAAAIDESAGASRNSECRRV